MNRTYNDEAYVNLGKAVVIQATKDAARAAKSGVASADNEALKWLKTPYAAFLDERAPRIAEMIEKDLHSFLATLRTAENEVRKKTA